MQTCSTAVKMRTAVAKILLYKEINAVAVRQYPSPGAGSSRLTPIRPARSVSIGSKGTKSFKPGNEKTGRG